MEKKGRILIVDDDEDMSQMLVEYMQRLGYQAEAVADGATAVECFYRGGYHAVMLDLDLPYMNGMDVLSQMQSRDNKVVVIVITGYGTIENAVTAIRAGAYDFIAKPPDLKALEIVVERAIEHGRLLQQRGMFRALALALLMSVPLWLVLGVMLAKYLGV